MYKWKCAFAEYIFEWLVLTLRAQPSFPPLTYLPVLYPDYSLTYVFTVEKTESNVRSNVERTICLLTHRTTMYDDYSSRLWLNLYATSKVPLRLNQICVVSISISVLYSMEVNVSYCISV